MAQTATQLGFVGLGHMGGNMAARYLAAGFPVSGEARSREHAQHLIDEGMSWRETPREVAEAVEVVLTSIPDDAALEDVAAGADGILAGLEAGKIWVAGKHIAQLSQWKVPLLRRNIGCIFQDFRLIPRFTVFENVSFVMRVLGVQSAVLQRKTFQVLKWVGLQHRMNALPEELSGGEQQRIAIARALVNDPQLVLADEPTGNLDPDLSLEIMNLFREINASGTTLVVATHDRELIRRVGRRAIALDHGQIVEAA